MKKILFILFFAMTIFGFANQTYDDTKFRQDLVNWATSKVGANYDMNNRFGSNTFDCSSLVSRAINGVGMTSISGKKSDYGTTANGLYRASGTIINKNDYNSLKPGDIVHFSPYSSGTTGHVGIVVANLGNGKVEIVDARGKAYGVVRRVVDLSQNSHYLGATSATQVLINNGYTPVNADGVVTAPDGQAVGSGNPLTYNKDFTRNISFDEIAKEFKDYVNKGVTNLLQSLIPFLTLIFLIDFAVFAIGSYLNKTENFMKETIFRLSKFTFFAYIIGGSLELMQMVFDMFTEVAKTLSGVENPSIDGLIDIYIANVKSILNALLDFKLTLNVIFNPTGTAIYFLFLLVVLIAMTVAYLQICYEIFSTTIIFYIAVGLSFGLFPLKVGKITAKYGTNPASVMVSCGLKIIITLMMVGVANGLLSKAVLKAEAIKNMDYMQVLWILGYTLVVCFLVKRIDSIFSQFR
ncbi:type IV secretion system protein [Sebaldella sp. S0638]|uniref:type IV secretion system protein n=1 Tax=Sebaldella sp. S0638 TaxID=2957809 RepID=UPI0020A0E073|nr:type IV secretion system protein [Sebaldella sp. S0638]MCP1226421.1 type IV secretion system protein [Sebaldella sp. S0638]